MVRGGNYTENPSLANLWKIASETGSYLKPAVAVFMDNRSNQSKSSIQCI